MKKIIYILLFLPLMIRAGNPDSAKTEARNYVNTYIVTNGNQGITGAKINTALNKIINSIAQGDSTYGRLDSLTISDSTLTALLGDGSTLPVNLGPALRSLRKVDTLYRQAGSALIYYKINGVTYSIKDSVGTGQTYTLTKNAGKDSIILTGSDGSRYAVKDSIGTNGITSVSQGYGITNTPNPITTTGTIKVDTSAMATKAYVDGLGSANIYNSNGSIPATVQRHVLVDNSGLEIYDPTDYNSFSIGDSFALPDPGGGEHTHLAMDGLKMTKYYIGGGGTELFDVTHAAQNVANVSLLANLQAYDFSTNNSTGFFAQHELGTQLMESSWFYGAPSDNATIFFSLNYDGPEAGYFIKPYDTDISYFWNRPYLFRAADTTENVFFGLKTQGRIFVDAPVNNSVTKIIGWDDTDSTLTITDIPADSQSLHLSYSDSIRLSITRGNYVAFAYAIDSVGQTANSDSMIVYKGGTRYAYVNGTFTFALNAGGDSLVTVHNGNRTAVKPPGAAAGITSLNGLSGATQTFSAIKGGNYFGITSTGTTHTFTSPNPVVVDTVKSNVFSHAINSGKSVTSGDYNVGIGFEALKSLTSGQYNVGLGYKALGGATNTATYNVGIGYQSLRDVTSNGFNTAIGGQTGILCGSLNVFVGYGAGLVGSGMNHSVFLGANTGTVTSGAGNILIGYETGKNGLSSGQQNVLIGYQLEPQSGTATGQLSIANAIFGVGNTKISTMASKGSIGIFVTSPTARLHLPAGVDTANGTPLKFTLTSAALVGTPQAGAVEATVDTLYYTGNDGVRMQVTKSLYGSATLDFGSTATQTSADLTIGIAGVADGDVVSLGVPNASVNANSSYTAWVSATNVVTVRFNNYSSGSIDPASATFKIRVIK